jgi:Mrp family chromosome partitioning ATPase
MTEHSKIPVPATRKGASLLERAVKTYDLSSLAPPPVPHGIAPAPKLRVTPTPVTPVAAPVREPEVVAAQVAAPQPAASVKPVAFTGGLNPVDRDHLREQGMIVPEGAVTGLLEEFRIVKRQLLVQAAELRREGGGAAAQRVLICSPHPGEGKTWCAVNLALAIAAEKESEVLLVDADFAKPSVLTALGLPGGPGLMDALADPSIDVAGCVIRTDIPGLSVLPAGHTTNSDSEFLSSSRTAALLARLTEGAPQRMVIFDSPPALAASPAAELAKYVGQALVVVRADRTGKGSLDDAISLLSACPNIQLLLNATNFSPSGRSFGRYYGYGS